MLKTIVTGLCLIILSTINLQAQQVTAQLRKEQASLQKEIDILRQALRSTRNLLAQNLRIQSSRKGKKVMLSRQQRERDALIKRLKAKEKKILKELEEKTKTDKELQAEIAEAIEHNGTTASAENTLAGLNFEKSRGKLSWPAENAVVKLPFGRYKVPGVENIFGNNPGLTLEVDSDMPVKNVFEGTVYAVFDMEGNNALMIEHGKYYITYSNLASVNVVKGQKVTVGDILGTPGINKDGKGEIEFIVMHGRENIDPKPWLRRQ